MFEARLFFATNRKHEGKQWTPDGYGKGFSSSGYHNLRFGSVSLSADEAKIDKFLNKTVHKRKGDGEGLAGYFTGLAEDAKITAYEDKSFEADQPIAFHESSSTRAFRDLKARMEKAGDVVVYIHGYNVSWTDAVGSALALQCMLNRAAKGSASKEIIVFLFSWPSDGSCIPFASYWSDRKDAEPSGAPVGRAMLKLRNFLAQLKDDAEDAQDRPCKRNIHLLCHSMGNFVLQNAMLFLLDEHAGQRLPRLFKHIFLCAADVDDDVFEAGKPMNRLVELGLNVSVYFNNGDLALHGSDATKGHPDRLGQTGVANDYMVHRKVQQVDCSDLVGGFMEHSYYLWAAVNDDIRLSLNDVAFDGQSRKRERESRHGWVLK